MKDRYHAMPPQPDETLNIPMELERRILHGLAAEWDLVYWRIPKALGLRLSKPQFRITDMAATWGHWAPETNTISLSRRLIHRHPWDAIRDVLLHETAHQITHQMRRDAEETPHGPVFHEACRLIGASVRASGRYPLLHERLDGKETGREDNIRLKVKKLLAMSQSGNPNEAAVALVKARRIMTRFQITDGDARFKLSDYISVFAGSPALRHTRDHSHLGALLAEFYFVEAIWIPAWVLEKEKMGTVLEISGTMKNVQMAGYVYDYIRRFIENRWDAYAAPRKLNHHRKTDYAVGIIQGFRSQLSHMKEKQQASPGHGAVITTDDPLLAVYVKQRYPRLRTLHSRATQADAAVLKDGLAAGRQLRITKPVSDAPSPSRHSSLPAQSPLRLPDTAK